MRLPRVLGVLGIALLVVAPFAAPLPLVVGYFKLRNTDTTGSVLPTFVPFTLGLCYGAAVQSLMIARYFCRPLVDPASRWGIFGARETRKLRVWDLMLLVALYAPMFAFFAQAYREFNRSLARVRVESNQMADEMEQFWIAQEAMELAGAVRSERLAAECRAKDARGEAWTTESWAEQARRHSMIAGEFRRMAAQSAAFLKNTRRQWAPLREERTGEQGR